MVKAKKHIRLNSNSATEKTPIKAMLRVYLYRCFSTVIFSLFHFMEGGYSAHMKPYHSQAFKVHPIFTETEYSVSGTLTDDTHGGKDFYHMEVYQANGSCAFVTPVYFG